MSRCGKCQAPMRWVPTEATGRPMPLDAEPNEEGNVILIGEGLHDVEPVARVLGPLERLEALEMGRVLYMPHHATCEFAAEFRSR